VNIVSRSPEPVEKSVALVLNQTTVGQASALILSAG
jgi:hypothetical protein